MKTIDFLSRKKSVCISHTVSRNLENLLNAIPRFSADHLGCVHKATQVICGPHLTLAEAEPLGLAHK